MAFSLSDLLNPAPPSGATTPTHEAPSHAPESSLPRARSLADFANDLRISPTIGTTTSTNNYGSFAPELFAGPDESTGGSSLATLAADATTALESSTLAFEQGNPSATVIPSLLNRESTLDESQYPIDGIDPSANPQIQGDEDADAEAQPAKPKERKYKKRTDLDKDGPERPSKHSSKNEGQHTDKRYLCYICNKLFTRRRSVRDHINKIHSLKTWEPQRSLEVTVDPHTGEPTEPIDDVISRGIPSLPDKPKKEKPARLETQDTIEEELEEEPDDDDVPLATLRKSDFQALVDTTMPEPEPESVLDPEPDREPELKTELPAWDDESAVPTAVGTIAPPPPVAGKKRPAPDVLKPLPAAITKKGIARPNKSTPSKKPKLSHTESVSDKSTPLRSPSAAPAVAARTPSSKLKKQTNAASIASSPASSRAGTAEPATPTPSASATPASSNDDGEIFCICRKGDNHTWMIACDGGCDEWFHGNCVNIRERDGDLIDKYICPRCTKTGLQTTWKRMCRRKGCRKPARVLMDPPSKYCTKECGRMFFVEMIKRGDPYIDTMKNDQFVVDGGKKKKLKKKRKLDHAATSTRKEKATKTVHLVNGDAAEIDSESRLATPAYSEDETKSEYDTDTSADEDDLPNRGGPLRAGEVKAIVDKCKSIEQWRDLGRKPDTPPRDSDEMEVDIRIEYDDFEKAKLVDTQRERKVLEHRMEVLDAREKLMELIKVRSASIQESVKKEGGGEKKVKDPCGFDPRLGWSEAVFLKWYEERDGKKVLEGGKVGPPDDDDFTKQTNSDHKMVNGVDGSDAEDDEEGGKMPKKGGVCVRNRCPRHKNWAKAQLAEIRFEQDIVKRGLRRCESLERGVRERGVVRAWESR